MPDVILRNFASGYSRGKSAVSGISLTASAGSVLAVLGPNGSGKSTLLKGLMGFPGIHTSGDAFLGSRSIGSLSRRKRALRIAYLPQSPPVPSGLRGLETVLLGRYPHREPWAADRREDLAAAEAALELVGASHLAGKHMDQVSGGELRLVHLAGVLAQNAGVILLDEPGSSLDYGHARHMWKLLERLAEGGRAVIATTHGIGMAGDCIDAMLLLSDGRPVAFGPPGQVLSDNEMLSGIYGTPLEVIPGPGGGGWVVSPGTG